MEFFKWVPFLIGVGFMGYQMYKSREEEKEAERKREEEEMDNEMLARIGTEFGFKNYRYRPWW